MLRNLHKLILITTLLFSANAFAQVTSTGTGTDTSGGTTTSTTTPESSNMNTTEHINTPTDTGMGSTTTGAAVGNTSGVSTTTTNGMNTASTADTNITSNVTSQIAKNTMLSDQNIQVRTQNGMITLDGTVGNQAQADAAVEIAKSIGGATNVQSNLKVGIQ